MLLTKTLAAACVLGVFIGPALAEAPFGFEMGMRAAGLEARGIKLRPAPEPNVYRASTAPKPDLAFEEYLLTFSPKTGLCRVSGVGKTLSTPSTGAALSKALDEVGLKLAAKFGQGEKKDLLRADSTRKGESEWMAALANRERILSIGWDFKQPQAEHIDNVTLTAYALSETSGYLGLAYSFTNFDAYFKIERPQGGAPK